MKKDSAAATSLWWMNGQGGRSGRPMDRCKYSIAQSGEKGKPQKESAKDFSGRRYIMTLTKRIGNTKYLVKVYFDEKGTMTMEDRILRLIARECESTRPEKGRKQNEIAV
jgi:hypothetical protein